MSDRSDDCLDRAGGRLASATSAHLHSNLKLVVKFVLLDCECSKRYNKPRSKQVPLEYLEPIFDTTLDTTNIDSKENSSSNSTVESSETVAKAD